MLLTCTPDAAFGTLGGAVNSQLSITTAAEGARCACCCTPAQQTFGTCPAEPQRSSSCVRAVNPLSCCCVSLHACSSHPAVAKVAFTGSTVTGKRVAQAAISNLRPATMELGGKSALIIFNDADLDKAVEWVMFGEMWGEGAARAKCGRG